VQSFVAGIEPLLGLARYLTYINLALLVFNLIPGYPLDGGRVFRAIVWGITKNMRRATLIAANAGRFFAFLFIFVGVWRMFSGNFGSGLWIAFIGWFLDNAASAQVHSVMFQSLLAGPHSFTGHEQSLRRRSRGLDAKTIGGRTHSRQRAALLPRQSRRHYSRLDDFASDQGSAAGPVDDDERRSGHAPAGTIETHKSGQGIVERPPTNGPRWCQPTPRDDQ
jgi:hypothetical protein